MWADSFFFFFFNTFVDHLKMEVLLCPVVSNTCASRIFLQKLCYSTGNNWQYIWKEQVWQQWSTKDASDYNQLYSTVLREITCILFQKQQKAFWGTAIIYYLYTSNSLTFLSNVTRHLVHRDKLNITKELGIHHSKLFDITTAQRSRLY